MLERHYCHYIDAYASYSSSGNGKYNVTFSPFYPLLPNMRFVAACYHCSPTRLPGLTSSINSLSLHSRSGTSIQSSSLISLGVGSMDERLEDRDVASMQVVMGAGVTCLSLGRGCGGGFVYVVCFDLGSGDIALRIAVCV